MLAFPLFCVLGLSSVIATVVDTLMQYPTWVLEVLKINNLFPTPEKYDLCNKIRSTKKKQPYSATN